MADTIQRESTPVDDPTVIAAKPTSGGDTVIEVPYMDYQKSSGRPFIADHYQLGDTWNERVGGFPKEVSSIEGYIEDQIKSGELANNQTDVKNLIKRLEKLTNVDKESRSLVKVETVAAYIDFLRKTENLKGNLKRYGNA